MGDNVGMNGLMLVREPPSQLAVIAILSFQILGSCDRAHVHAGQCCPAELIDSGKLLGPNLPGSPPGAMTFTLEYVSSHPFDLAQLLRKPTGAPVIWTVNSAELDGSILRLRSAPKEDTVAIYNIRVRRWQDQRSDEFSLIVLPASTREHFSSWYEHEGADLAWLSLLPPVYSSLGPGLSNPEPRNCATQYWENVHKLDSNFHPGGAYEMRSRPVGEGHGHQAVYDSAGRLIQDGPGAGSADKGAPIFWAFGLIKHRDRDVRPYIWAAQLDGNPVNPTWLFRNLDRPLLRHGENIKRYQSVRPALWGRSPEVAAGTCISPRR
jgi:hypothetical protein